MAYTESTYIRAAFAPHLRALRAGGFTRLTTLRSLQLVPVHNIYLALSRYCNGYAALSALTSFDPNTRLSAGTIVIAHRTI